MKLADIKARGERARQIAEAYQGQISARSNRNRIVVAEIPCMIGYPVMFAMSGFAPEFVGIETHNRPARPLAAHQGTIACSTCTLAHSVPQNFAYYRIDLAAKPQQSTHAAPSVAEITRPRPPSA